MLERPQTYEVHPRDIEAWLNNFSACRTPPRPPRVFLWLYPFAFFLGFMMHGIVRWWHPW